MLRQANVVVQSSERSHVTPLVRRPPPAVILSRAAIASAVLATAVLLWGGYTGHWSWTGLSDNDTLSGLAEATGPAAVVGGVAAVAAVAPPDECHPARDVGRGSGGVRRVRATRATRCTGRGPGLPVTACGTGWSYCVPPVVIATVKFWTAERTMETRHWMGVAAVIAGFVIFAASAYLLPINWSGFVGNTLWDWVKLLFIPILMPLVLVPAVAEWINGGIEETDEADQTDNDATPMNRHQRRPDAAATPAAHRPAVPAALLDSGPHGFRRPATRSG